MLRPRIAARCGPVLLLCLTVACARSSRGVSTTSGGEVAHATTTSPPAAHSPHSASVSIELVADPAVALGATTEPGLGVVLTDSSGRAIYVLDGADGTPLAACTGDCATAFDAITGTAVIAAGQTALDPALLGVVTRADGTQQATYHAMPLYYAHDDRAGADRSASDASAMGGKRLGVTSHRLTPQGTKVGARAR